MAGTVFGFYDLDASPQRGVTGALATRLGLATESSGFIDGTIYVRSDNAALAIQLAYDGADGWEETGAAGALLQSAGWRSRERDVRRYALAGNVPGDAESDDSTFFIVQRFAMAAATQTPFADALLAYIERYARPIPGYLDGGVYASVDGTQVVLVMPWAHEAALHSMEDREGSLAAMQRHLRMCEHYSYASYARISYLRASREVRDERDARHERDARNERDAQDEREEARRNAS